MGDWLVRALVTQYALVTLAYCVQGHWLKALYWVGVSILNLAWIIMLAGKNL